MDRITELEETHKAINAWMRKLSNDAQAIAGRAKAASRDLTPGEQGRINEIYAQFNQQQMEHDTVAAELATARAAADADAMNGASRGRVVPPYNTEGRADASAFFLPKYARVADLFPVGNNADPYGGKFQSIGELALAIVSSRHDPRLIANSMVDGTGASGGFLVPAQFIGEIMDAALAQEVIRPNATVLPMGSNDMVAPAFDYLDGTSGKRAGLQLQWGSEGATLNEQVGKARQIGFKATKGSILVRVTSELTEDAPAFDRQLRAAMAATVAIGLDIAFTSGTGAGQPLGILNAPALITVAKEGSQAANTLLVTNLAKMLARLSPSSYRRSTWLVHPTVLPVLLELVVTIKNVAGTENVGGGLAAAVVQGADGQLRIYGRPVEVTEACSTLSSAGDVVLCDLSQYAVGVRRDVRIDVAHETYFASDEIGFRLTLRMDGQPLAAAATKLRDGTNTVSPFVALGAR